MSRRCAGSSSPTPLSRISGSSAPPEGHRPMKSAVIVFPGSNCDRDLAVAIREVSGEAPAMIWHRETELHEGLDLIAVPGGFSYGHYLHSGAKDTQAQVMAGGSGAAERTGGGAGL